MGSLARVKIQPSQNTNILHCTISFRCTLQLPFFCNLYWRCQQGQVSFGSTPNDLQTASEGKIQNLMFFLREKVDFFLNSNPVYSNRKNPYYKCHTFNRNTKVLGTKIKTNLYQLDWNFRGIRKQWFYQTIWRKRHNSEWL